MNPFRVGEIKGNKKGREREGEIEFQKEIQIFLVASDIKLEERVAGRTLFTSLPVRNKSVFFISGAGTGLGRVGVTSNPLRSFIIPRFRETRRLNMQ